MIFVLAPLLTVASEPLALRLLFRLLSLRVRKDRLLFLRCRPSACWTAAMVDMAEHEARENDWKLWMWVWCLDGGMWVCLWFGCERDVKVVVRLFATCLRLAEQRAGSADNEGLM